MKAAVSVVAAVAVLAGCDSARVTDGNSVHVVMRTSLACQDRSKLLAIGTTSADGDALMSERIAVAAIEDGNCRLLRYGDKVIADKGQKWLEVVRVQLPGREQRYWISTRTLLEKA